MISEERLMYKLRRNWKRMLTPGVILMILCGVDILYILYAMDSTMGFSLMLMPFYIVALLFLLAFDLVTKFTIASTKRIWHIQLLIILPAGLLVAYLLNIFPGLLFATLLVDAFTQGM